MYFYLDLLFNICLLKKGPQDIPYSRWLLIILVIAYALTSFLILRISVNTISALLQTVTEILVTINFTALLLIIKNQSARFVQTTSALFGVDTLISFFAIPVIASISVSHISTLNLLVLLILMIWHWIVIAHIFKNALDTAFFFAVGIAFLYFLCTYLIIGILFPQESLPS